jgi:hypothetical protein
VSVPAGSQRNADAFCDGGEVATGGGFDIIEGIFSEPPTNVRNPNIEEILLYQFIYLTKNYNNQRFLTGLLQKRSPY